MKKILVIHTNYQSLGGEDVAVDNEVEFLKENYEVETLYFSNNINQYFSQFISFISNRNKVSEKRLKKILSEFKPDIVYVHNTWFKASLGIFKILKKHPVKVILKLHNFRYDCTRSFNTNIHLRNASVCNACGLDRKSLGFFNKYYKESFIKSVFINSYGRKYFKILQNYNLKIFVLTDFHKNYLTNLIGERDIEVFPNFIDINKNKKIENTKDYIIYAGRISKEKGVEDLISTFISCNFDNIELKIVGNGPLLSNLKSKYNNLNIKFLGEKTNEEVLTLISESKAVVTATKLYEGQPMLLCEASSMGIPSIFPRTGGVSEYFPKDYKLSYNQFDYGDLKKKLELIKKQELIVETGKENFDFISSYLNKQKLLDQFQRVSDEG
mgnify:FL=1